MYWLGLTAVAFNKEASPFLIGFNMSKPKHWYSALQCNEIAKSAPVSRVGDDAAGACEVQENGICVKRNLQASLAAGKESAAQDMNEKLFKGLRLTAGRRPSNDVWRMVWEDWAEILRANPGRAMLRTEAGIMRSACLYGSSLGLCWTQVVPMLGQVGPMLSHLLGPSWAYVGPILAQVGPMLGGPCRAYVAHAEPPRELCWGHVWAICVETILRCNFFRPGPPPGAQNNVKTDVF